eukprot:762890-Hanusia_phi.AAC.11
MIKGVTLDNLLTGGPAANSKKLAKGDVIVKVDGKVCTSDNVLDLLRGEDVPGSLVVLTMQRNRVRGRDSEEGGGRGEVGDADSDHVAEGGERGAQGRRRRKSRRRKGREGGYQRLTGREEDSIDSDWCWQEEFEVALARMATGELADKKKMFEFFTALKDHAVKQQDKHVASIVDESIVLWTNMLEADAVHDQTIVDNVQAMQQEGIIFVKKLKELLAQLRAGYLEDMKFFQQ